MCKCTLNTFPYITQPAHDVSHEQPLLCLHKQYKHPRAVSGDSDQFIDSTQPWNTTTFYTKGTMRIRFESGRLRSQLCLGFETQFFFRGPEWPPLLKTWGPKPKSGGLNMYMYVERSKNVGAIWAPDLKNRGGGIWKIRGPMAPVSFEPCILDVFVM